MRILHVITDLGIGGAEIMLVRLVERLERQGIANRVAVLAGRGVLAGELERMGVPVEVLELSQGRLPGLAALRLPRLVRRWRPDLVQGWMYHGNLAASFAAGTAMAGVPVVWGIHFTPAAAAALKPLTRLLIRGSAPLAATTAAVVYCSAESRRQHEAIGYARSRSALIVNGIDGERFRPDPAAGPRLRRELGVPDEAVLVGMLARYAAMKDHANLVAAAARLRDAGRPVHLVLAGSGVDAGNAELTGRLAAAGLAGRASLLGERGDVPALLPGLDMLALPSAFGEAFPLILCEAMACGLPCVATDVGDCAAILGEAGTIVPPRDPEALAAALQRLVDGGPALRLAVGSAARLQVLGRFGLDEAAARYAGLYDTVARRGRDAMIAPSKRDQGACAD